MSAAIVATAGSASANSYVTLAEAEAYMEGRSGSASWYGADSDTVIRALLSAAHRIDQETYKGRRTDVNQAMAWPRSGVVDSDGYAVEETVVPAAIKNAQVELALVLSGSATLFAEADLDAFKRVKAGPLEAELRDHPKPAGTLPSHVVRFLRQYLAASGAGLSVVRT